MMKFSSISYYLKAAIVSLLRNRLMALASIVTVFSCISIITFSYCIAANIDYMLEQLENSLNLSAYVDDSIDDEKLKLLETKIKAIENVESVRYISSEEALESFSKSLGEDDQQLLAGLKNVNPLPRSFVVNVKDLKQEETVIKEIESFKVFGISEVEYDKQVINAVTTINTGIRVVSILIILALIALSVVIIINTIKITVNARRTEITIMKYIGATDWFIKWPFIIEGVLIGLVGALIPLFLCMFGYSEAVSAILDKMPSMSYLIKFKSTASVFLVLAPLSLTIGIGIGVVGSLTSIKKYLHA